MISKMLFLNENNLAHDQPNTGTQKSRQTDYIHTGADNMKNDTNSQLSVDSIVQKKGVGLSMHISCGLVVPPGTT